MQLSHVEYFHHVFRTCDPFIFVIYMFIYSHNSLEIFFIIFCDTRKKRTIRLSSQ
jgi:hypothetical protein